VDTEPLRSRSPRWPKTRLPTPGGRDQVGHVEPDGIQTKSHCPSGLNILGLRLDDIPPKTPQDYRDRAAACERLADSVTSAETRENYLAVRWRALADEDEAKGKPPDNSQAPVADSAMALQ
jgi:hypothetical protein